MRLMCIWVGLLLLVQGVDGGVGLLGGGEGDEAEAAAATGLAVLQDDLEGLETRIIVEQKRMEECAYSVNHLAELGEGILQAGVIGGPGETARRVSWSPEYWGI